LPVAEFTDTHVHFWDTREPGVRYLPSMEHVGELERWRGVASPRYWADDFIAESRFHSVARVVHVQAAFEYGDPTSETRFIQSFADRTGVPHGIIGWADLASDHVAATLERHSAFAAFRGIRVPLAGAGDYRWQRGYGLLARLGLVFCSPARVADGVDDIVQLLSRFPEVTYSVDHAGSPQAGEPGEFERWRSEMRKLARWENTVVKISGPGLLHRGWTIESIRPWVLECIEAWGTTRVFFGTDWPIGRMFASYGDVVGAFREIVSDFSPTEQADLLSRNATRVFRLE
jgi:predicted TIM-barrel fold metal-dependent hydrolase